MNVQRTDTASQSLMRSYLVKLLTKAVKGSLLRTQVPYGGARPWRLSRSGASVHDDHSAADSPGRCDPGW